MARKLIGLIGKNIGKSLAPALHEDAFRAAGMTGHYHLMDADDLPGRSPAEMLVAVRTTGFAGINVTFPFKEAVIPLLDDISPEAAQIGAVNTIVFDAAGRAHGHNTDSIGFRRAFEETLGARAARGQTILLLGAGGAGRAAAVALLGLGASRLRIFDSDTPRALRLVADLTKHFGAGHCEALPSAGPAAASVAGIVNATPVGMSGFPGMPLSPHLIETRHFVADVIYSPIDTDFVLTAKAKGCRTMNGGGMCVHQAVEAFRLFTGRTPDVERMRRTFEAALAERDAATQA